MSPTGVNPLAPLLAFLGAQSGRGERYSMKNVLAGARRDSRERSATQAAKAKEQEKKMPFVYPLIFCKETIGLSYYGKRNSHRRVGGRATRRS